MTYSRLFLRTIKSFLHIKCEIIDTNSLKPLYGLVVLLAEAVFRENKLHDIAHMGIRVAIGVIFIIHGTGKFNPGFVGFLTDLGLPAEMQIPIALAETIPGILLIIGILSRISSSLLSIIMLGAIFYVKGAASITGEGGIEYELILLASNLVIIVAGPGRISVAHAIKKLPRFLH
jgi:putative oxidoreductase